MILCSKYHGCGNSFVIMKESELLKENISPEEYPALAQRACDINTGIGADGMIVVRESPALEMVFYNCDGSRAPMCGNGIRCFAHFCREEGVTAQTTYPVKTLAGDMIVDVACTEPFRVKINMGKPIYTKESIKVETADEDCFERSIKLRDGTDVAVSSLFMGTIHTVVFVDDFEALDIPAVGEELCNHPTFTEKTNVNFVKVIDDGTLAVKTYERGVGMTLACGTGACASVVAANAHGLCGKSAAVKLKLGSLNIDIAEDGNVYMEGPSEKIMTGELCVR